MKRTNPITGAALQQVQAWRWRSRQACAPEEGGGFTPAGVGRHPRRVRPNWELILVERGRLGLVVGIARHDLGPGSWVLMPAEVEHNGTAAYPRDLRFLWIHFHLRPVARGVERMALPLRGRLEDPGLVSSLLRRLIDHHASSAPDQLVDLPPSRSPNCAPRPRTPALAMTSRAARCASSRPASATTSPPPRWRARSGSDPDHLGRRFHACQACR